MSKKKILPINLKRLKYVLDVYAIKDLELMTKLNLTELQQESIRSGRYRWQAQQDSSLISKIGYELGRKKLYYFLDQSDPPSIDQNSIAFRKKTFNITLDYDNRWWLNKIQDQLLDIKLLMHFSDFELPEVSLSKYSSSDSPKKVALEVRTILGFEKLKPSDDRKFLQNFINLLSTHHLPVYEFVEAHNSLRKTSIEGMFIKSHGIVLKRLGSAYFKREIFTLAHELGHVLLRDEQIDQSVFKKPEEDQMEVERWCNSFAYYFIVGNNEEKIADMVKNDPSIDNYQLIELAKHIHISRLAIFLILQLVGDCLGENTLI